MSILIPASARFVQTRLKNGPIADGCGTASGAGLKSPVAGTKAFAPAPIAAIA
ncbi:hypothetical protein [Pararhizobium antarcticum]|uniref:hypothetical protein n=1 Tax=Pararhizobium antarcticum TaxID=1798805 RepID=UPI000A7AC390|nr:hypothetical protein [Pararhizobium antarcticum]